MSAASVHQTLTELPGWTEAEIDAVKEELTTETRLILLAALRECVQSLNEIDRGLVKQIALHEGQGTINIEGLPPVEVKFSRSRTKWQWDKILQRVVAHAVEEPGVVFDPETGERVPPSVTAEKVARAVQACIGFSAGKKTGLAARGLNVDDYCTPGEYSARVTFAKETP